jgi:hypothetical protein
MWNEEQLKEYFNFLRGVRQNYINEWERELNAKEND